MTFAEEIVRCWTAKIYVQLYIIILKLAIDSVSEKQTGLVTRVRKLTPENPAPLVMIFTVLMVLFAFQLLQPTINQKKKESTKPA